MSKDEDVGVMTDAILTAAEAALGSPVQLEIITTDPAEMPQAMVQTLPSEIVRRYKNGDYVGRHNWRLYLRIPVADTGERVDAIESLSEFAAAIRRTVPPMPAGFEFAGTRGGATPVLEDATEAFETYQVTFETEFKRSRERA